MRPEPLRRVSHPIFHAASGDAHDDRPTPDTQSHDVEPTPVQPTGSGVANLEVAYEQMKLAEAGANGASADAADAPRPVDAPGVAETEARPS